MKFKLLLILSLLVLTSCKEQVSGRSILVVGDSWATMICDFGSLDRALEKVGITDVKVKDTCFTSALIGVRADRWTNTVQHKYTLANLLDPNIQVMYLSLGGNDIMNYWNTSLSPAEEQIVFDQVITNVQKVVRDYQKVRPDLKILLSGYDFPRFYLNHPIGEYHKAFEAMGRPTPYEINSAIVRFSERISKLADQKTLFYIQHYGLTHYHFGNSEVSLQPMTTLSPEMISSPFDLNKVGGNLSYQTDRSAMLKVKVGNIEIYDAFHLNRSGFDKVADHVVLHYLREWLQ